MLTQSLKRILHQCKDGPLPVAANFSEKDRHKLVKMGFLRSHEKSDQLKLTKNGKKLVSVKKFYDPRAGKPFKLTKSVVEKITDSASDGMISSHYDDVLIGLDVKTKSTVVDNKLIIEFSFIDNGDYD